MRKTLQLFAFSLFTALLLALAVPLSAQAQTTIFSEDFSDEPEGATSGSNNGTSWNIDPNGEAEIFSVQRINGDKVFAGVDLSDGTTVDAVWKTDVIDISNYSSVRFSVSAVEDGDHEDSDHFDVAYSTDGGNTFTLIEDWNGSGTASHTLVGDQPDDGDWGNATVTADNLSGTGLVLRISMLNNSGTEHLILDDITVKTGQAPTTVQFAAAGATVNEGDGTATIAVSISNPDGNEVSVDVAFDTGASSAEAADIGNYTTQTVTFPTGATDGDTQSITITLSEDTDFEGEETAAFTLKNLQTSGAVQIGTPGTYGLEIEDNDAPDLAINEFLADPNSTDNNVDLNEDGTANSGDEFVEILNTGSTLIDISGFKIDDESGGSAPYEFPTNTKLAPGEVAVVIADANNIDLPGFTGSGLPGLNNGGDDIRLLDEGGNVIQVVSYGSSGSTTEADGISSARNANAGGAFQLQNTFGMGNLQSAGHDNNTGAALPVQLALFNATVDGGTVALTWQTISEKDNAGFEIQRAASAGRVASSGGSTLQWKKIGFVEGAGTSLKPHTYRFETDQLAPGTYHFRLKQIDRSGGEPFFSQRVDATVALDGRFALTAPRPNPFSRSAHFRLTVKEAQHVDIAVYNVLGQRVRTLVAEELAASEGRTIRLDGEGLSSGAYFVRITGETFSATRRVVFVR